MSGGSVLVCGDRRFISTLRGLLLLSGKRQLDGSPTWGVGDTYGTARVCDAKRYDVGVRYNDTTHKRGLSL